VTCARRFLGAVSIAVIVAGCTFPALVSPTPSPSPVPTAPPTPTPMASPSATLSPSPTPGVADVPAFGGGEVVATAIDGLRVRQRPGTGAVVVAGLLPLAAELEVRLGPIPVDGLGWYLVADADADEPEFDEGWIAAGFEPEPFLRSTGRTADDTPVVAAFALTGDAEYGPFEIADAEHAIRWIAVDPEGVRCSFAAVLEPAGGEPVPAIRATIGDTVVPGTLQPSFFAAQDSVRGQVFLTVASDCAWALSVVRVPPDETPSPTPGG
jgi:hypothetical protein